jgi:hypothetical protein
MKRIRILLATLAFFAASSLQGSFAVAGHQWCEEDPEFLVNGRVVDVSMFFERSHAAKVKGSVHFDMQVPSNAVAAVVSLPGTIPVVVTVSMNASASFPTYTLVTGLHRTLVSTLQGTSTKPTKAKFYLTGL